MNEDEKKKLRKVLKEMRDAQGIVGLWLKGSAIDLTLKGWIKTIEELVEE